MKLTAFRVKNYRSIVDSKWNSLSPDNVTVLIGQNESGKTTVLEALRSFFDGVINDDILRSDLSLPEVSCKLEVEEHIISNILQRFEVPQAVADFLHESREVSLIRSWKEDRTSYLELGGDAINSFYTTQKETEQLAETLIRWMLKARRLKMPLSGLTVICYLAAMSIKRLRNKLLKLKD